MKAMKMLAKILTGWLVPGPVDADPPAMIGVDTNKFTEGQRSLVKSSHKSVLIAWALSLIHI